MTSRSAADVLISGVGVTSAIGQGVKAFTESLMMGRHGFGVMKRPARQRPADDCGGVATSYLGAEIPDAALPGSNYRTTMRTASLSSRVAVASVDEAWNDANLEDVEPTRIGLIAGGSNVQQRELVQLHDRYRGREAYLRPTYGMIFMDSDVCGICTEAFAIHGLAYTVGGASASGQVAVLQAVQAVHTGQVDACIALGSLMDLSYWECQGLRSMGAMGSELYAHDPAAASRPFDRDRDGFIYGEACGAVVVERADGPTRRGVRPYARIAGSAMTIDGNRQPDPSHNGEARAIDDALWAAGLTGAQIDYVNPHGTGSPTGDPIELEAFRACGIHHAYINTTKSIIGHGLTAAGSVELIALLLQMREQQLHPSRNLANPIERNWQWVGETPFKHTISNALSMSIGFGGINTAVCVSSL